MVCPSADDSDHPAYTEDGCYSATLQISGKSHRYVLVGVPQAVQLGVLGDAGRLADPPQPLGQADAVPGGLALGEEDVLARLVQAAEEDQQLEDHGVNRHDAGLPRLLRGLVPAQHDDALFRAIGEESHAGGSDGVRVEGT